MKKRNKILRVVTGVCAMALFGFFALHLATISANITYTGQGASAVLALGNPPPVAPPLNDSPAPLVAPPVIATPTAAQKSTPTNTPAPKVAVAVPTPTVSASSTPEPVPAPTPPTTPYYPGIQGGGASYVQPPPTPAPVVPPADTTPPVLSAHADITAEATSSAGSYVSYTAPTATDAVDGSVSVSCTPTSDALFALGTTSVACSATDSAGNVATSSFAVVVQDTTAPTLGAHEDISVEATSSTSVAAEVAYTAPTATDAVDGSVSVSCTPTPGSLFAVGSTTALCSAEDAAGNTATSSFVVGVYLPPAPAGPTLFTMASQSDQSFLCDSPDGWFGCFAGGDIQKYNLGSGADLQGGTLQSVTIALDETYASLIEPWWISVNCFNDSAYTTHCSDWVAPNAWNASQSFLITEQATTTADGKYWTAYFTNPAHEANFDGSSPVVFNPAYYYQLEVNDNGAGIPAYGSELLAKPYFLLTGVAQ